MRVKEELLINILKDLSVGDDPVKVPSWCRPRDINHYWERLNRTEDLLLTEDDDGNIHVQVVDNSKLWLWVWSVVGVTIACSVLLYLTN